MCNWNTFIKISIFILFFSANLNLAAQRLNIIPKPSFSAVFDSAAFVEINKNSLIIINDSSLLFTATYLSYFFHENFNLEIPINFTNKGNTLFTNNNSKDFIFLKINDSIQTAAYIISIKKNIMIDANSNEDIFHGIQSLFQLTNQFGLKLPVLIIQDKPQFIWRGMHLDVCRHFFSKTFIKKYIDLLAMYKMNIFHWHLTEDQGWRIEIKKYPKLTEIGAWRNGSMVGPYSEHKIDNKKYGGYYSQNDIKEIVAYAKERCITIIPEIEMPGHSLAALASYPDLSCTGGPFEVAKEWGVFEDVYCAGNEKTFEFLQNVLDEVCELFPGEYIHIGGDECPKERWKYCNRCQKRIQENNLKDENELQSYFIQRIEKYLNKKGKKIIGWDEILEGGLAPNAAVMSWRGTEGGEAAAKQNHNVVMTPGSHCYFDHYQGNARLEPHAIGGFTPIEKVYEYSPISDKMSFNEAKLVLGAQGNVWTEYINDEKQVEYMMMPRMIALSEVLWTNEKNKEINDFLRRLQLNLATLENKKINYSKSMYNINYIVSPAKNGIDLRLENKLMKGIIFYHLDKPFEEVLRVRKDYVMEKYNEIPINITKNTEVRTTINTLPYHNPPINNMNFYISKATSKKITFNKEPHQSYNTGGGFTLVNGIKGYKRRINSEWLAWQGENVEITIDLEKITKVSAVEVGMLNEIDNWIYLPSKIEVLGSNDDINYKVIKIISNKDIENISRSLVLKFKRKKNKIP